MNVLLATTEFAPVIPFGGIGEGIGGLARALCARGERVTVVLPAWRSCGTLVSRTSRPLHIAGSAEEMVVREGQLEPGLSFAIVDFAGLRDRPHLYGDDVQDVENARRFALFSRAVVELAVERSRNGQPFAILHAHEWPCAVVPYLARLRPELTATNTILTIHNLAFQGVFPPQVLAELGLAAEHAAPDKLGHFGYVSFMRGGIASADAITTVSPTYACEILTPPSGHGLEDALRARKTALHGLLNGIDATLWDPERDPHIAAPYSADDRSGKNACKRALLREVGLTTADARPLLVSVGRIIEQKGSDLLAAALPAIVDAGASVLVAGGGREEQVQPLRAAAAAQPAYARFLGAVPDELVHRLIASADLVAMPSRYEPCGIVQMYAHRYGAVPIARRTGGLRDTIAPIGTRAEGTGFPSSTRPRAKPSRPVSSMPSERWRSLPGRPSYSASWSSTTGGQGGRSRTWRCIVGWPQA